MSSFVYSMMCCLTSNRMQKVRELFCCLKLSSNNFEFNNFDFLINGLLHKNNNVFSFIFEWNSEFKHEGKQLSININSKNYIKDPNLNISTKNINFNHFWPCFFLCLVRNCQIDVLLFWQFVFYGKMGRRCGYLMCFWQELGKSWG